MASGIIPGLVVTTHNVSWKYLLNFYLFWISETKFVIECVARGVNGMTTEMSGAKCEPVGWGRLQ